MRVDTRFVSPDEMLEAAKQTMLDNREPKSQDDWVLIVNFMACNIEKEAALPAIKVFKMLYDIPLSDEYIVNIVDFQINLKSASN